MLRGQTWQHQAPTGLKAIGQGDWYPGLQRATDQLEELGCIPAGLRLQVRAQGKGERFQHVWSSVLW